MQITHHKLPSIYTLPFTIDDDIKLISSTNNIFSFPQLPVNQSTNIANPNILPAANTQHYNYSISQQQYPVMNSFQQVQTQYYQNYQNPTQKCSNEKKGVWTHEEDELLCKAVNECKPILWDVVAEKIPGRNAVQCRERWRYRLDPSINRSPFQKWEDEFIISERKKVGNMWTLIANKLPGRTVCAVKNRWYSVLRHKNNDGMVSSPSP